ncbi:hypothetical protein CS022_17010 [Veronia nyctiphanis]|uniref:Uncharacterized protein n=1 Tax=Veronia nyctiphanis TaxID=1278244 RepID=A0A4Q0YQE5_9GAMM|nr:hypothetical protein [Veronia nyctiphanis]RXJ72244.1 hypothetical protein CS022_17010 [Veronia nyctiphanis]
MFFRLKRMQHQLLTLTFCLLPFQTLAYQTSGTALVPANSKLDIGLIDGGSSFLVEGQFPFSSLGHVSLTAGSRLEGDWVIATGLGFTTPFTEFIDISGDAQIYSVKFEKEQEEEFGKFAVGLSLEATTYLSQMLDASVKLGNVSFGGEDSQAVLEFGGRLYISNHFSIGLSYLANGLYEDTFKLSISSK